jgi:hypothetical protein
MAALFSPEYKWLWMIGLGGALFFPVRQFIWVMSVRRVERRTGPTDEAIRESLKRRATFTSVLLCFVFAVTYVSVLFKDSP